MSRRSFVRSIGRTAFWYVAGTLWVVRTSRARTHGPIAYLTALMDQREVPEDLGREIDAAVENATKGEISRWLSLLDVAPWTRREDDKVVTLGPREVVH